MKRGYLIYAVNTLDIDYIRSAYALALSIKKFMPLESISLVTNNEIDAKYKKMFDNIIDIPWDNNDMSLYKVNDRWKLYHCTPYDETIVFDADMLVTRDITFWWKYLEKFDLFFPSDAYDYRGNLITDRYYRKAFDSNNLPNLYSTVYYFKKNDKIHNFFNWVEIINNNWELFYGKFIVENYPIHPSMDINVSLACKILDLEDIITQKNSIIKFVHMKPHLQSWQSVSENWVDDCMVTLDKNCNLKINNFYQYNLFHYVEEKFLSNKILKTLEIGVDHG